MGVKWDDVIKLNVMGPQQKFSFNCLNEISIVSVVVLTQMMCQISNDRAK